LTSGEVKGLSEGTVSITADVSDLAGNAATQATASYVYDCTAPTIATEAITSATGVQNSYVNTTDVITATVTFGEAVSVSGSPRLVLDIGGPTVYATYAGGSGTSALTFTYTIQSGETDTNGISIPQDALDLNGGTITDLAGNTATITKAAVSDNASYMVDTTAPGTPTIDVIASSDTGADPTDNISFISTPQILVTLGSGSVVGDVVKLKAGNTEVGSFTLTATEITNGNVTITASALGAQGAYVLKAYVTDIAGNASADSGTISYVLDTINEAPTASFVSANSTSFTILASDVDAEPNWSKLTLVTPVLGANSVTNGSNTTFNVAQQISPTVIDLSVTDLTQTTAVTVGGQLVSVALGTNGKNEFDAASGYGVYYGFGGADTLTGGDNGNTFIGGSGSDILTLGSGVDKVLFDSLSGTDTVNGFTPSSDLVQLARSVMTALGAAGALSSNEFASNSTGVASTSAVRVVYNQATGALFYDADGSGSGSSVQLATLIGLPVLTHNDIVII
jgi:Ca2+-binding RTX toxin-like protein